MKKFIAAGITVAILVAIPATASASVERYQAKTATFTVTQPSGAGGLWTHEFRATDNPCDDSKTFTGTGVVKGMDYSGPMTFNEDVTATFGDGTVSLKSNREFNYVNSWSLTDAKTDGSEVEGQSQPTVPWTLMFKVSKPVFTTSNYKNHGEYVKAMGGGADAAHSCIGMPKHD